jgi:ligand-binding sensor domain-containing protein/signal transduction histidine kinase
VNVRISSVFRVAPRTAFFFLSFAFTFCALGDAPPPTNMTLTNAGLVLWLKADADITADAGGLVERWADQSGHQNHALQTNAISRPRLIPDAFNGKPALRFNGVTNFLEIPHSASLAITGDIAVFAVVRVNDFTNLNGIIGKTSNNIPAPYDFYIQQQSGRPHLFRGDGTRHVHVEANASVSSGEMAIVSAVVSGTKGVTYLNGAYNGGASLKEDICDAGRPVRVGSRDNFEAMLKGDLAEIILINGTVSDAERVAIHSYLGSKYLLSVVHLNVPEQPTICRFEGQAATFSVSADDPVIQFQWQKNGVDIPEATNALYTTPVLTLADNESVYRARVSAFGTNRYVGLVTLRILPDTEPVTSKTSAFLLEDQSRSASGSKSESIPPPYSSRLWQTGEDASRNIIQAVTQTSDGVLWIGTAGGLARFDGEQFEFVPIGEGRTLNQKVNSLCAGADGSLWVGTAGAGAFQFLAGKWIEHPMPAGLDANVLAVQPVRDGSVWIGTRKGMAVFKNGKLSARDDKNDSAPGPEKNEYTANVRSVAQDANGELWAAAGDHLIRLHDGAAVADFPLFEFNPTYLRSVICRRDGSVWMGCNSGLVRFQDEKFTHFAKHNGLPDNVVITVLEDSRGNLWIGTSGGLCRFADGRFVVETTSSGEAYDQIWCLFEDRENNLWVGAKNGLYQLRAQQFTTYTTRHGLAHNNVTSVYEDREGGMWIGTWGGGLHHLHDGKITIYSSAKNKTMRNDLILALEGAKDGGVWFSADFDGGLYRLKEGQMTRYAIEQGFGPTAARDLLEDSTGRLVIGTARESVHLLENGKIAKYIADDAMPSKDIRCLLQGRDGRLWIGTETGLICKTNESLSRFMTKDGLSDNFVFSLYEDEDRTLWVGTAKGLSRMSRKSKVESREPNVPPSTLDPRPLTPLFTSYAKQQGLFDDGVIEILEDDSENLWLATRQGVVRISRKDADALDDGRIPQLPSTMFGRSDGMISPVCVGVGKPSALKSRDGRLWFATTKGLAVTDPKLRIAKNEVPPPVVIRDVLADKKKIEDGGSRIEDRKSGPRSSPSSILHSPSSRLRLPPGRGELEFRYTALSYAAPEKNRFKYKLAGFDSDWVDAGTRRVAFYNSVPPGSYAFQVRACNNDGVWNSAGATVKLTLEPHYWQTKWFRGLSALAAIGFVAGSARYITWKRVQARLLHLEQQHAVEKERTRIAQDMHDELGARLTEIRVLSDLTEKKKDQPAEVEAQSRRISNAAGELIRNLHTIVWAVNPANDSLEKLADFICGFAQPFLKASSIRCRLERPEQLPDVSLSSEVRHNIVLVIKEALNNTVKHAQASEVKISLSVSVSKLSVMIVDDGKGFQTGNTAALGNGLQNMEKRMANIDGRYELLTGPGKGTTIRLEIPLKNAAAN